MSERGSPLSNDVLLAVLQERLANESKSLSDRMDGFRIDFSEMLSMIRLLEKQERDRNGAISDHTRAIAANNLRWDEHMIWAAGEALKITALQREKESSNAMWKVLSTEWRLLLLVAALSGTIVGIITQLIGA